MAFYATIEELLDSVDESELTYRSLHSYIYIKNKGEHIKIPYDSILHNYLPFLKETAVTTDFSDMEKVKYQYKPKSLSYDLYGTTELWSALLELNNMVSLLDLKTDKPILVFDPNEVMELLNEAMIMEGIIE